MIQSNLHIARSAASKWPIAARLPRSGLALHRHAERACRLRPLLDAGGSVWRRYSPRGARTMRISVVPVGGCSLVAPSGRKPWRR